MTDKEQAKWVSARIGTDTYQTILTTNTHTVTADEPLDAGGKDTGPSPGDFLRMSLASCTAITLRMYANRKGFDVKAIEVKVFSEETDGGNTFHSTINITGTLNEDQRNRMLQIAKKCPVHKVLTNPIEVVTQIL